jgi:hypothetical protein
MCVPGRAGAVTPYVGSGATACLSFASDGDLLPTDKTLEAFMDVLRPPTGPAPNVVKLELTLYVPTDPRSGTDHRRLVKTLKQQSDRQLAIVDFVLNGAWAVQMPPLWNMTVERAPVNPSYPTCAGWLRAMYAPTSVTPALCANRAKPVGRCSILCQAGECRAH